MRLIWYPTWQCQLMTGPAFSASRPCPYCAHGLDGHGQATFYNQPTYPLTQVDPAHLIQFFLTNLDFLDRWVDICGGGEPLTAYPVLIRVFKALPQLRMYITTNLLYTAGLDAFLDAGLQQQVINWACSYHHGAGQAELFATNYQRLCGVMGRRLPVTVVVCYEQLDELPNIVRFLTEIDCVSQFQVDAYRGCDTSPDLQAAILKACPGARVISEPHRVNVLCRMYAQVLNLVPDGTLFPCVTRGHTRMGPIGHVSTGLRLASLPAEYQARCWQSCCQLCDFPKHVEEPCHVATRSDLPGEA